MAGLLVRNGHVGGQAAAAILLDLAARQVIGLELAGPQLTLRVPPGPDGEDLAPYERRVLDRTGPTVAAWKVRRGIYQQVNERDTVRASVTRRYRYVYRVQVLARRGSPAGSPPGP